MADNIGLIRIHPSDNVAVALADIAAEEAIECAGVRLIARDSIPPGHKIALSDIAAGEDAVKYGFTIGRAICNIAAGSHVHSHNLETSLGELLDYTYQPEPAALEKVECSRVFEGYERGNGEVGIRNEIWIIPTVACVNSTIESLARAAQSEFAGRGLDGIHAFPHAFGCSQLGEDHTNTQKILADLVNHPNAGGVLVVGLGCENNNISEFQGFLRQWDPQRVKFLNTQDVEDEIEVGIAAIGELVAYAEGFSRSSVALSRLKVGFKCGGSDGFSGITANPLVGAFSDMLTSCGGTAILTEVPEMFGAETILMNRCVSKSVFEKTVAMINDFKSYFIRHDQPIYENPSPGNREGGITTLEEKSLGCVQKGGTSPVVDVLGYGDRCVKPGLNLLYGPGNDSVAASVLAACGAHLILFTTGRGTPLGTPVPVVKIATNSVMAARKRNWTDFDAGVLLEGRPMPDVLDDLVDCVIEAASGRTATANERNNSRSIGIFKDGVTL